MKLEVVMEKSHPWDKGMAWLTLDEGDRILLPAIEKLHQVSDGKVIVQGSGWAISIDRAKHDFKMDLK